MKNRGLIIAIIVILLLVGGYMLSNKKGGAPSSGNPTVTSSETSTGAKSLKDLLSAGIAQKCSYSMTDENGTNEGTTYVSGGKMRTDASTTVGGETTGTHMISDGNTSWIWTEGDETGFKMTVEAPEEEAEDSIAEEGSFKAGTDWDQKVDYDCSAWVTDGSYFTPPANVKFTDFSEMLKGNQGQ